MKLISEAITSGSLQALAEKSGAIDNAARNYVDRPTERHADRSAEDVAERISKRDARRARRAKAAGTA